MVLMMAIRALTCNSPPCSAEMQNPSMTGKAEQKYPNPAPTNRASPEHPEFGGTFVV